MDWSPVLDISKNIFYVLLGIFLPILWIKFHHYKHLNLIKLVFPVHSDGASIPKIHLRVSLDEIIFGEYPGTLRGYTHSGDLLGAMNIIKYFHDLPVDVEFGYFSEIGMKMQNVVLLGASSRSDVSREVASVLYKNNIRVRGSKEHAYFMDPSGRTYKCCHTVLDKRVIVTHDAGVIFRKIFENGSTVLMLGGIHTFGTQAAAEVAMSDEFQLKVKQRNLTEFVQFVAVDVVKSGRRAGLDIIRQNIRWRELPLIDASKFSPGESDA